MNSPITKAYKPVKVSPPKGKIKLPSLMLNQASSTAIIEAETKSSVS